MLNMLNTSTSAQLYNIGVIDDDMIRYSEEIRRGKDKEPCCNLNVHGLDAEAELTGVMAEVIKHELDREVINDLYNFAGAGSVTWDKTVPYGVSYTEHKESLVDSFISANNLVYSATKRAQTNWIVAGVQVCDVIESLRDFQAAPGTQTTQTNAGALKIGTLKNRWTIIKDPFLPANKWIQGYKGSSFMDAGYVMAPSTVEDMTLQTTDEFIGDCCFVNDNEEVCAA
jgi:hypothetical protein